MNKVADPNSHGRMMPMHYGDIELRVPPQSSPTGSQFLQAVGCALGAKMKHLDEVVYVSAGEGTCAQGDFHEALNWSAREKLPIIFVIENNNYAMGTSIERTSNVIDIYKLADAYEMPSDKVDGMTPELVHEGVARAVKRARDGEGPTLLEMKTYRYRGHSVSDPQKYRSKDEVEEYKDQDPIIKVRKNILENNFATEATLQEIDEKINGIVEASVKFAEDSPWPDDSEVLKDVYIDQNYPFIVD